MKRFDITKTNVAVERLIETTKPAPPVSAARLQPASLSGMAGRFEEIFAPDMTVEKPVYHFNMLGTTITLDGAEAVKDVYREWTRTGECIFYTDGDEKLAVSDDMIVSTSTHLPADPGGHPRRRRRARRPRGHLPGEDRRAHDLALRRPWPPDRRGCLGIRRDRSARSSRLIRPMSSPSSSPPSCSRRSSNHFPPTTRSPTDKPVEPTRWRCSSQSSCPRRQAAANGFEIP